MVGLARQFLGTDDVRMYLALVTAKYAGQPSEYNQFLHADFPNHTLTVPRPEAGYQQMETFVYLNDVGPHNGATRFVSRARTATSRSSAHTLDIAGTRSLYDDPGDASAPAGSIVVYRPDVYHRSVDFTDPAQARYMLHVSYRPGRRGVGWLPGLALQGVFARVAQLRPAGHTGSVDRPRLPAARPPVLDRGDVGRWPGAIPASTSPRGGRGDVRTPGRRAPSDRSSRASG